MKELPYSFRYTNTKKRQIISQGFSARSRLQMKPNLKTIRVIGCDKDEALMNAIHNCFQDAQNCYVQVTRKTTQKGNSELISERDIWQLTICYWVYMVKIQGVFMKRGFRKLMGLKASCDYLQQYNFHSWFLKYETEEQKLQNWLRLVPVILQIKQKLRTIM